MYKQLASLMCFFSVALPAYAGGPSEAIEPQVKTEIAKMASYLQGADTLQFKGELTTADVSSTLQRLHYHTSIRGAIKRPNLLFLEKTGAENVSIWVNGREAIVLDRKQNKYVRIPVSGNLDQIGETLEDNNVEMPFGGLLRGDISKKVSDHVFRAEHYGDSMVDGVKCSHEALRQDSIDWQVWIAADGAPKKLILTSKMLSGMPEHEILIREVRKDEAIPDSVFNAALPAGAAEVPVAGGAR